MNECVCVKEKNMSEWMDNLKKESMGKSEGWEWMNQRISQ